MDREDIEKLRVVYTTLICVYQQLFYAKPITYSQIEMITQSMEEFEKVLKKIGVKCTGDIKDYI